MAQMTKLLRQVGRLFVVGLSEETLTREEEELIRTCGFNNFILFSRNVSSGRQVGLLCQALRKCCLSEGLEPPLIMVDEEGGPVQRLRGPCAPLPSARSLGHSNRPEKSVQILAKQTASCLKGLGINFNLAPVLDLATLGEKSFIYERSFGKEPSQVGRLGRIYIRTMAQMGVATCGKHFPGLGEVSLDPHLDLPRAYVSRETLLGRELEPFRQAIAAEVPAIMTSHVIYPALDPEQPATFSRKIVQLLRKGLGFQGLLLSDDLEMGAIAQNYSLTAAAEGAFYVGHDLLLFCHHLEQAAEAVEALARDLSRGEIPEGRLLEALTRQRQLRAWLDRCGSL